MAPAGAIFVRLLGAGPLPQRSQSAKSWANAPVAQLDRALPSEGKCKLFLMVEGVVKNE